jgi:hypothetical protein
MKVTATIVFVYGLLIVFGGIFGRWLWNYRKSYRGATLTIILAFLVGFLLGVQSADRKVLILLFFVGLILGFWLHETGKLRSAEY